MSKTKRHIQSVGEEIANAISHGVGSLLSIAGTVVLIVFAALNSDALAVVSASLYGATLIILYTNSTLYHSLTNATAKKVFRIFDHCSIFLLILGTYIPVSLALMRNWIGWVLFGINMGCTVLGILFNSINLEKFSRLSLALYVIMGWSVVLTIVPVVSAVLSRGVWGLILLVLGGLFYTFGILFYNSDKKYMHFIWHFFVLGGSVLHYFFVLFYCIPLK